MYLSRFAIDTKKYSTMKALYNIELLHAMVESSFDGPRQRNLWRIDQLAGKNYLLLLSNTPPANNKMIEQIGYSSDNWETKSYDTLLKRIKNGTKWNFRLTANPTVSVFKEGKERGKVKAITVAAKQREWLKKQSEKNGFSLEDGQYDVVKSEWITFKKKDKEVRVLSATFEGTLTVTNEEQFVNSMVSGIGREKAYGMGLLTVVPHN